MVGFDSYGTNSEADRTCECSAGTAPPAMLRSSGMPDLAKFSHILAAKPPRLPESASPDVILTNCSPEAVGAVWVTSKYLSTARAWWVKKSEFTSSYTRTPTAAQRRAQ